MAFGCGEGGWIGLSLGFILLVPDLIWVSLVKITIPLSALLLEFGHGEECFDASIIVTPVFFSFFEEMSFPSLVALAFDSKGGRITLCDDKKADNGDPAFLSSSITAPPTTTHTNRSLESRSPCPEFPHSYRTPQGIIRI